MAIKYYDKYPQRWESPSQDYPQGAFKNLSALGEQDGSYLEKDWLNDYSGFFGALLRNAEMTPDGTVDTAQRSQFYDALVAVAEKVVGEEGYRKLDNNEFEGFMQVRATDDNIGAGVILKDSSGKPKGQMTYNSGGLQFTQYDLDGVSNTHTLPKDGGELLVDKDILNEWGDRTDATLSQSLVTKFNQGVERFGIDQTMDINNLGVSIRRKWCTDKDLALFVDANNGSDSNDGSQSMPFKTITRAMNEIPQNIYHKVRVYILDGVYDENLRFFNYFITPRGSRGLRFVGHVARLDGENHPIYTDDKPENVIIKGFEHVFSNIRGTEEMYIAGVTFENSWFEAYDMHASFRQVYWKNGHTHTADNSTRHALGGHYSTIHCIGCKFDNVASIGAFTNDTHIVIENCELTNLHSESTSSTTKGVPLSVSFGCTADVRSSPTISDPRSIVSGEMTIARSYSNANGGYEIIGRSNPLNNESIRVYSHNRASQISGRGAGLELYGVNHPESPGDLNLIFGGGSTAKTTVKYSGSSALGGQKDILIVERRGDVRIPNGSLIFSSQGVNPTAALEEGQAMIHFVDGIVRISAKKDGEVRYKNMTNFSEMTPY